MANPNPTVKWKKGQSGNPKGGPLKDWTMSALYKQAGEESDETGVPRNKIVARVLWNKAKEGDVVAIKELNNRIDGQAPQSVTMNAKIEGKMYVELPTRKSSSMSDNTDVVK